MHSSLLFLDCILDEHDRPFSAEFFTGSPSFFHLKSRLYTALTDVLNNGSKYTNVDNNGQALNQKWIKKANLEKLLGEEILDHQVNINV